MHKLIAKERNNITALQFSIFAPTMQTWSDELNEKFVENANEKTPM